MIEDKKLRTILTVANTTFTVDAMFCGYHIYQGVWDPSNEEEVLCVRESGNPHDLYAVRELV